MAMPRKGSRLVTVDGQTYRWRVSAGAVVVEHASEPRGVLREPVDDGAAPYGPGRVAQLIRHGVRAGWSPTSTPGAFEVPTPSVWDDPRGRDHYDWMRVLHAQLAGLEAAVDGPVELGAYWWHGTLDYASGGLGARVRFGRYAELDLADTWEGALCISGNRGERAYADLFGFPFRGQVNLGQADERCWDLYLEQTEQHPEGVWVPVGWRGWAGEGEWSHATEPGSIFYQIDADGPERPVSRGEPIPIRVDWDHCEVGADVRASLHQVWEHDRGQLVGAARGQWCSWAEARPIRASRDGSRMRVDIDLAQLHVPGGWVPGSYRVVVRVRGSTRAGEGSSDITVAVPIEIAS